MQIRAEGVLKQWLNQAGFSSTVEADEQQVLAHLRECERLHKDYDFEHRYAWAVYSVVSKAFAAAKQEAKKPAKVEKEIALEGSKLFGHPWNPALLADWLWRLLILLMLIALLAKH